nr:MAG TPA: Tail fiber protein [Caudoviricetes sp.]
MNEPIFIARQDTLEQEILPAHWLSQYKLFGEESYTFQDKEIWKRLCMSRAAANDRDMHAEALEEMLTTFSAEHTGKWMLTVYGMDAAVLEGLASMAAIAANGTAMAAVAGNALLMHAITNSETAMQAISRSQTAMQRIANSTTAMDAISGSKIARGAVQASPYYNSYIKENDMAIAKLVVSFANLASAGYSGMAGVAADATAMNAVAASSTAMNAVAASSVARNAISASPYYDAKIKENDMAIAKLVVGFANLESARYSGCAGMAADSTAMTAVAASSTAMTAVAASGVALKAIAQAYKKTANMLQFLKAVNASDTLVKRIYSTLTNATALFGAAQLGSQDSVENANSWATTSAAPNAFLACACGYYGSSSDSVSVTYNGTVIAQKKTGTKQPGSVASTNVNAITMAPSTFTENGDGYLAVQKFTAK